MQSKNAKNIICLVGMMGVGKTTIGSKIAKMLDYYFIDSDQEIEDAEKTSISQIFSEKGEAYFREVEAKIIAKIISRNEKMVLSIGGGAFINDNLRQLIKDNCITIWIQASVKHILLRTKSKNGRPLLNLQNNRKKIITQLIAQRTPFYQEAQFSFDSSNYNPDKIAKLIVAELNSYFLKERI
jgi:shikimate kinase